MSLLYWAQIFAISEWVIRLVMLPVIVLRKEKPGACLAWLALIFFEPWLGLAIYLLIGENRLVRRRLALRRGRRTRLSSMGYPSPDAQQPPGAAHASLSEEDEILVYLAEQVGGLPVVGGNRVVFVADADSAIDQLVADVEAAQDHVHLLFYIFADDEVGRRVGEALVRARQRGVACRVLADGVGSRRMFRRLAPYLKQHEVEVLPILPVRLWRLPFARLDLRNHRKLAVIDGRIAYTGSQNIVEATHGHKKAGAWHDIMARLTGPVVRQLQTVFVEDWFHESGRLLEAPSFFPEPQNTGPSAVQVVPTGPDLPTEHFQDLIVRAIFMAQQRVVITSPYFVPNEAMLLALRVAAAQGVRVDVVVPERTDHWLVDAAGAFYLEYLTRFGVNVFFYRAGMLHSKTLTVDGGLAMFGSANYDIRSFALNFELNLLLYARQTVAQLYCLQELYREQSTRATRDDWPTRTLRGRLKVNLAKLLSPLL